MGAGLGAGDSTEQSPPLLYSNPKTGAAKGVFPDFPAKPVQNQPSIRPSAARRLAGACMASMSARRQLSYLGGRKKPQRTRMFICFKKYRNFSEIALIV